MAKHIITVATEKGGAGKSTTVINLSVLFAQRGHRVLVVDIDPQGNTTSTLTGIDDKQAWNGRAIFDFVQAYGMAPDFRRQFIHETKHAGISIIPVSLHTEELLRLMDLYKDTKGEKPYKFLSLGLADMLEEYDYIFIDTPPTLNNIVVSALYASTDVIIPMYPNKHHEEGLVRVVTVIQDLINHENRAPNIAGILFAKIEPNTNLQNSYFQRYREDPDWGPMVFDTVIRKGQVMNECIEYDLAVVEAFPTSNPAKDYAKLAGELLDSWEGES